MNKFKTLHDIRGLYNGFTSDTVCFAPPGIRGFDIPTEIFGSEVELQLNSFYGYILHGNNCICYYHPQYDWIRDHLIERGISDKLLVGMPGLRTITHATEDLLAPETRQAVCDHEFVNVSFTGLTLVCKKCDKIKD